MKAEEVREVRAQSYVVRACYDPEDHEWDQLTAEDVFAPIVVLILCRKCGRTPLEMLAELEIP